MVLEVTSELHGVPLVPQNWSRLNKNRNSDFLALPSGNLFERFSGGNLGITAAHFYVVEAISRTVFYRICVHGAWVFAQFIAVVGEQWVSFVFRINSQISRVRGLDSCLIFAYFPGPFPGMFQILRFVVFAFPCDSFFVPKVVLGWIVEASEKWCKNRVCRTSRNLKKGVCGGAL